MNLLDKLKADMREDTAIAVVDGIRFFTFSQMRSARFTWLKVGLNYGYIHREDALDYGRLGVLMELHERGLMNKDTKPEGIKKAIGQGVFRGLAILRREIGDVGDGMPNVWPSDFAPHPQEEGDPDGKGYDFDRHEWTSFARESERGERELDYSTLSDVERGCLFAWVEGVEYAEMAEWFGYKNKYGARSAVQRAKRKFKAANQGAVLST